MQRHFILLVSFLLFACLGFAQESIETDLAGIREELIENRKKLLDTQEQKLDELAKKLTRKKNFLANLSELMAHYKAKFNDTIIYVDISAQKLYLVRGDEIIKAYTVSTSKHGSGFQQGSFMTPLGIHKIKEKIGAGEKTGTVFDERVPTKKIARIYTDTTDVASDLITTRILWLEGLEDKVNRGSQKDSYDRFIYIHGTHEEGLIGKPSSLGCVRMKNDDIIQLFDLIRVGTFVIISAAL